jgi:hypothetical protein
VPTVTISSQLSEAIYMVSIIGLAALLARPVYLAYAASQERGADVIASGLGSMIDSMSPGTSVVTRLETYPGVQLSVALEGTDVSVALGGSTATAHVRWGLPHAALSPGEDYNFTLEGGEVLVAQARHG